MTKPSMCKLPDIQRTRDGKPRRVGIEIEISGLGYQALVDLCASILNGKAHERSRYVSVIDSPQGEYLIELDSDPIKQLDLQDHRLPESVRELGGHAMDVIDAAAERIVPLEIISPPLPLCELDTIEELCNCLRDAGALGSRESIHYAFGLQLNPELPDLKPATLINYFRAFAALYHWLKARHQLDISRKFTHYIEPWDSRYIDRLLEPDYSPDEPTLIADYLADNPTRNRALDLLPLFSFMNDELLRQHVQDPRIKARPTLHYRLPDCDIDNPDWHFSTVWNDWIIVEQIANHPGELQALTELFRDSRILSFSNLTTSWRERCHKWLENRGYV